MLIRVRTNVGLWRIENLDTKTTKTSHILEGIKKTRPNVVFEKPLSKDPSCSSPIEENKTLEEQKIGHGSMIFCRVDAGTCVEIIGVSTNTGNGVQQNTDSSQNSNPNINMKRKIMKDGSIQLVHDDTAATKNGFRPGMLALRDMKKSWTLAEFVHMDSQFSFKIKRQKEAWSKGCSLDSACCGGFQNYLREFNFSRQRFGYLYGSVDDDNMKVKVECIYEPPQEADPDSAEGFIALEDPNEEVVEQLAEMLGLKRVGWIFGHPPREKGFQMTSSEILMAAELQLEAADGVEKTPFVTVKVSVGEDGNASFEAFQVSLQCMQMVAEEALEIGEKPGFCDVNETFTAIQEGKNSKTVENNFFLMLVPIEQHQSDTFICKFPEANRDHGRGQTHDEMKRQLSKSGSQGWSFIDLLSDFQLLIYLCKHLDFATDMPKICTSIKDREIPLDEGYKIIIASMAGMDGSY